MSDTSENINVTDKAQLVDWLKSQETPKDEWRIGTEHEKFLFEKGSFRPVRYEGEAGIGELLSRLASVEKRHWKLAVGQRRLAGGERLRPAGGGRLGSVGVERFENVVAGEADVVGKRHVDAVWRVDAGESLCNVDARYIRCGSREGETCRDARREPRRRGVPLCT